MVPLYSDRISPVPPYSIQCGCTSCTGLSPSAVLFSKQLPLAPHTLMGSSAFARHYLRNHYCFLFLQVLRCFSSPGCHPCGYVVFNYMGCPIRTSTDQRSFAPPRSFSQLTTSFVVSESQGIHRTPLFASYSFSIISRFCLNLLSK